MKFSEMSSGNLEDMMKGVSLSKKSGGGKKGELLEGLKEGVYSVKEFSVKMGISCRNVSSVLCYLRDDGYEIRKIGRMEGDGLVLWSVIRKGEKVGNRMELGVDGYVVRFNFEKLCFEDEIVDEVEEVEEVVIDEVKKKK